MTNDKAESIAKGKILANAISSEINDFRIGPDDRSRLAAACYYIALDHHIGTTTLFDTNVPSPALALLRLQYEAFVRGSWIHYCATDVELEEFKNGKYPPEIKTLLSRLEQMEEFNSGILSNAHEQNWDALCGLTHTGIQQVLMVLSDDGIERNCSIDLNNEAMGYAGVFALLSGLGVAKLADSDACAERLLELCKGFVAER